MTARNLLIFCVVCLLCIGSVMVASASMPYAEYMHENPFHYVVRHAISIAKCSSHCLFGLQGSTQSLV
jgi:cell division protein FtsW